MTQLGVQVRLYYTSIEVQKYEGRTFAGFVDYCCPDKISRLEVINMAKELGMQVEGTTFWWLHLTGVIWG